jgi:predicted alpha/beta superfamily hydrolase
VETRILVLKILLVFVLLLTGCSTTTPEPITVTVPVTVKVPVTVEVTRVVEVTSEPVVSGAEATIPMTEVTTLHSSAVGRDYRIYVALPLSYSRNSSETYPVVYLLDGDLLFGALTDPTRLLQSRGELPELIIVGIGYGTLWENTDEVKWLREIDLTPGATSDWRAGKFLQFIQQDLFPYIDANYRTDPMDRTIGGASYGGLFSLYVLFHAPETFNRYIAVSPSLWWNDRVIFEYEEEFADEHSDLPVKLFLAVGGLEEEQWPDLRMVSNLKEFHKRLEDRNYAGLEMEMVVMEDETHHSVFLGALSRGLRSVFR